MIQRSLRLKYEPAGTGEVVEVVDVEGFDVVESRRLDCGHVGSVVQKGAHISVLQESGIMFLERAELCFERAEFCFERT